MINPKLIVIFALVGFILSFISGLFGSVTFGILILRALICAVVLAGLSVLYSFIYSKFLQTPQMDDALVKSQLDASTGKTVDIVIDDQKLPEDSDGPSFTISPKLSEAVRNKSPLAVAGDDQQKSKDVQEVSAMDNELEETLEEIPLSSADESAKDLGAESANAEFVQDSEVQVDQDDLGVLPDISTLAIDTKKLSSNIVTNSDFATAGSKPLAANGSMADTETMAKAIRTVLSKEN